MKTRLEHVIDIPAEEFFEKVYFNEEFNAKLYELLAFRERTVVVERDEGDTIYREVKQVPERDLPGPVKKVLGTAQLEYLEKSTYYKGQLRADIEVVSSVKPDKVKTLGSFWVEPLDDGRCKRCFELEVKVSIFGIGGVIEKLILADVEESYGRSADLTNQYLHGELG